MTILGISDVTGNHSHSSIAILNESNILFALSHERTSRIKNDNTFPEETIKKALDYCNLSIKDIDCFACGYPPANYYNSLLQYNKNDLPRSMMHTLVNRPVELCKHLVPNLRKGLFDPQNTNGLFKMGITPEKFMFIDHHLAHVSAGYFSSGFDDCLAISYGGFAPHISGQNVGLGAVYRCQGDKIDFLEDIPMFAAGCFFSGITVALGFKYMQQEGKTMGLAAYGDPSICLDEMKKLGSRFDGTNWTKYEYWIDYIQTPRENVFLGSKSGKALTSLIEKYGPENVAAAAQRLWEENLKNFVNYLVKKYKTSKFILSGGVFLNVQLNSRIQANENVESIFMHPHTGDGSTTIGAAIEAHRKLSGKPVRPNIHDTGLGLEFSDMDIIKSWKSGSYKGNIDRIPGNISEYAAQKLAQGKIIGWFQGREEYGPRSLGHRCILGDPRDIAVKEKNSCHKKQRSLCTCCSLMSVRMR